MYEQPIGMTEHKRGAVTITSMVLKDPALEGPASERRLEVMVIEGGKTSKRWAKIPTVQDGAFKGLEARGKHLEDAGWTLQKRWFEGRDAWAVGVVQDAVAKPEDEPQTPAPAQAKPKRQRKMTKAVSEKLAA